jgi:membrane protein required for colicin V production
MNLVDIFLGFALLLAIFNGWRRGFLLEMLSMVIILLGIWAAMEFSTVAESALKIRVSWTGRKTQLVAFVVTFFVVVLGVSLLGKILTKAINKTPIGLVNCMLGSFVAVLKSILMTGVVLSILQLDFAHKIVSKEDIQKSILAQPMLSFSKALYPSVSQWLEQLNPDEVKKEVEN